MANLASRLKALAAVTGGRHDVQLAAAERRLGQYRDHFASVALAKLMGDPLPEPNYVPYDGMEEDRELVARHYPPDPGARARVTAKLDQIHRRMNENEIQN